MGTEAIASTGDRKRRDFNQGSFFLLLGRRTRDRTHFHAGKPTPKSLITCLNWKNDIACLERMTRSFVGGGGRNFPLSRDGANEESDRGGEKAKKWSS